MVLSKQWICFAGFKVQKGMTILTLFWLFFQIKHDEKYFTFCLTNTIPVIEFIGTFLRPQPKSWSQDTGRARACVSWRNSNNILPLEGTCASASDKSNFYTISLWGFVICSNLATNGFLGYPHIFLTKSWKALTLPPPNKLNFYKRLPWAYDSHRFLEIALKTRSA